ncbi:MAG: cellulase family glycosylhydrolase [Planctomycetes bacterium]|nr:cellulase family glycosylhydrolase [Planctomycetota bacterium]
MNLRHAMLAVVMLAGTVLVELASDACLGNLGQNSVWGAEQADAGAARARPGVVEIKLGATIPRTWKQVQAHQYAYGPKQDYDAATGETHIYLPYGNNRRLYHESRGALYDPQPGRAAKFHSSDGNTEAGLCFQLHFDRPIGAFRYAANWSEFGLASNTVAGVEYSIDGRHWKTIREIKGAQQQTGIINTFVEDFKATDLYTQTLYLRYYSRDPKKPGAFGPGRWLQIWMAGDPSWGDAATTFFERQLQVWATPAKTRPAAGGSAKAAVDVTPQASGTAVGRPTAGSFGICSSAEAFGDHARLFPLLEDAGVSMVRLFPSWDSFQPQPGQWNFQGGDELVRNAGRNGIQITAPLCYLAPWASAAAPDERDYGKRTRTFPIKDMRHWREYVEGVVTRYRQDVKYWEVWNEFQGFNVNGTVQDYVQLVRQTYEVAKRVDPKCQVGLGTSSFDLSFLEETIVQGAADHFDFIDIHPYELMGAVMEGREPVFLQIMPNLRKMLARTKQRTDIPVWVGEIGTTTTDKPEDEQRQAEALVKAYVLCLAQGIDRVFWFEGRGPYRMGLIRSDPNWTKRPSCDALRTLTGLLGPRPERLGWLNPTGQSHGFVFQGAAGPVLVTWAATDQGDTLRLPAGLTTIDLAGKATAIEAEQDLALTRVPVFVTNLPPGWVADARSHRDQPFPWQQDYSQAETVSCKPGTGENDGLTCLGDGGDSKPLVGQIEGATARRSDRANKHYYLAFDVADTYASVGDNQLEITVVARRVDPAKAGGCNLFYESTQRYRLGDQWWTIPAEPGWHRFTFRINDANFANNWGYNFSINTLSSPDDVWIKEVLVKRAGPKQ